VTPDGKSAPGRRPPVLWPVFVSAGDAASLLGRCLAGLDWHRETFTIFGRLVDVPRRVAWVGDPGLDYRYTGRSHTGAGWPVWLVPIRDRIREQTGLPFNHVILNHYRDGRDHMGWHRDDEKGVEGPVAILSLGATRTLRYRQGPGSVSTALRLESGSLLVLDGRLQHVLVRDPKSDKERISLTFRNLVDVEKGERHPAGIVLSAPT
jgi:alkylated DNA repair dioxygenase AlkB